jgi:hypothetical protein
MISTKKLRASRIGHIDDRQFIVQVWPYECPYVLLVNRRTGEEMKLGDLPVLSPNRKRFVVTGSFADGECSAEYHVAIFSLAIDPSSNGGSRYPVTTNIMLPRDGMARVASCCRGTRRTASGKRPI